MNCIKDILWSPTQPDKFLTFGTDLRLYQVEHTKDGNQKSSAIVLSESTSATLLSLNTDNRYMKCVSWYPKSELENLLAVGLENGKIVLTSLSHTTNSLENIGKEFVPRHSRPCNSVAWNPVECSLLAAGLEKFRTDFAIVVWDVTKPSHSLPSGDMFMSLERRQPLGTNIIPDVAYHPSSRALTEIGPSDTANSLQWFSHQPKTLVCGMNNKVLKIFDLRDASKHHNITTTKAVYGVCVDPFYEHRLASFFENQMVIWDVRNFEKPVVSLCDPKPIAKVAWCPTRNNLLASVTRESSLIKIHSIQQASIGSDEIEPTVLEHCIQPTGQHLISTFAWHPTYENRMLAVISLDSMYDFTVFDRITLNWSPTSEIVWTDGRRLLQCLDSRDQFYDCLDDISIKMRKRALADYGLKMEQLWQNGEAVDDPVLRNLWNWLDVMKSLHEEGKLKSVVKNDVKYEGVLTVISTDVDEMTSKTELVSLSPISSHIEGTNNSGRISKYTSEEREKALQLCGWGKCSDQNSLQLLLERLQMDNQYERAASIAVFNLDLNYAIQILHKGASTRGDTILNIVAMAISGYSKNANALWEGTCSSLHAKIKNAYLRVIFAFLTCEDSNYDEVLNETGIAVQDRVAFACLFLSDTKLAEYLNKLTVKMTEIGNLDGILLTGLTADCLPLLQRYVDVTGDVQTASLVILHAMPSNLGQDPRAHLWVESYKEILDRWQLWHQRAMFDVQWYKASPSSKPSAHVFVSCNFCGKSVSSYLQMLGQCHGGRPFARLAIPAANKSKISCCPGCRKPLPRCSLCLTHMGTPAGSCWRRTSEGIEMKEKKLSKFSSWFTWCQACRHGGHAIHIKEWFTEHTECPVTACNCKCMSLDA